MRIPLPPFTSKKYLTIPIAHATLLTPHTAQALVIKDGGDDIDATDQAHIVATMTICTNSPTSITILGGHGVGRATLPGLPIAVGEWAINPTPRTQITFALKQALTAHNLSAQIHLVLSVPHGESIAKHTLNPKLGIVGGISILGTTGIVKPFSHKAYAASILQQLSVAKSLHLTRLFLSTGRASERLLQALYQSPPQAFIQVADFLSFGLHAAGKITDQIVFGCFFGKMAKLAQGMSYTHAQTNSLDKTRLAKRCQLLGLACASKITTANTARQILEDILADPKGNLALSFLKAKAIHVASRFAGHPVQLHVFHHQGYEL